MTIQDARQLLGYALSQFVDIGRPRRDTCRATLLLGHPAWRGSQDLWLTVPSEGEQTFRLEGSQLEPPALQSFPSEVSPSVPKWLRTSAEVPSGGFFARTQSHWNQASRVVQSGFLTSRQLAGADGGEQEIVQKAGLISDMQMVTLAEGHSQIEQQGGWQSDDQTVIACSGHHEITQVGGRGRDSQRVQVEGGSHKIHQIGGHGSDGQRVTVYGDGDSEIVLEGGEGEDTQEVYLRGSGHNSVVIRGGQGNDTLKACGGFGSDNIVLDGGDGDDLIVYRVAPPFARRSGNNHVQINGGPGSGETNAVLIYQEGHPLEVFAGDRRVYASEHSQSVTYSADERGVAGGASLGDMHGCVSVFGSRGAAPGTTVRLSQIQRCRIVQEDLSEILLEL